MIRGHPSHRGLDASTLGPTVIRALDGHAPELADGAFVHDGAEVIGRVRLGRRASVWPRAVIRGPACWRAGRRARRLDVAGTSTALLEAGDHGPPVVLLHGPGANATHWLE